MSKPYTFLEEFRNSGDSTVWPKTKIESILNKWLLGTVQRQWDSNNKLMKEVKKFWSKSKVVGLSETEFSDTKAETTRRIHAIRYT